MLPLNCINAEIYFNTHIPLRARGPSLSEKEPSHQQISNLFKTSFIKIGTRAVLVYQKSFVKNGLRLVADHRLRLGENWFQPNGRLKDMACREVLITLYRKGLIDYPAGVHDGNNHKRNQTIPLE